MTPEFSRPLSIDAIGDAHVVEVDATETERAALARRFDLRALERLHATVELTPNAVGIGVTGRIEATVVQPCVVTDADVRGNIDEAFALRFVAPDLLAASDAEERELGEGDLDTLAHDGSSIDLGEAVAQTLGLALDPFPRAPDAESEAETDERRWTFGADASPFAGLKGLLGE